VGLLKKIWTWIARGKLLIFLTGVVLSIIMCGLYVHEPYFLRYLDFKSYDIMLSALDHEEPSDQVVIVDLDEASLAEYGQFPWPRYRVAMLLAAIQQYGASAIGLDILFAEKDRTSPVVIQEELRRLGQDVEIDVVEDLKDNDRLLANVLANGPFVLGYFFDFENQLTQPRKCNLHPINVTLKADPGAPVVMDGEFMDPVATIGQFALNAPAAICNLDILSESVSASGFYNTLPDRDGIVRRTPLIIEMDGKLYPSLALAALMTAERAGFAIFTVTPGGLESLRIKDTTVPLDAFGRMNIKYRGKGKTYPYISAKDILKSIEEPTPENQQDLFEKLSGKIVFVGTSAAGLKDLRATPLDPVYPGVEAHATIVDNILTENHVIRPDWAPGLEFMLVLAVGIVTSLLSTWARALFSIVPLAGLAVAIGWGAFTVMNNNGLFLSPVVPLITLGTNFSLLTLLKFWKEEREKKFFHGAFSQYVSKGVVDQIVKDPGKLSLSGEEKEVSILFSDIRSFTSISESLSPTQVTDLLHEYFTPMTGCIINNSGTMDKFIGDAIMAFWNAPLDTPGHQELAVKTGLEMVKALKKLNQEQFGKEFGLELRIGIGLHAGMVRVGNLGSYDLFDYTIIGDNVNLASRLEGLTKFYGQQILVSETIRDACKDDYYFQEIDNVRVKGKVKPITIYTVYSPDDAQEVKEELDLYNRALEAYKNMDFTLADKTFGLLREKHHDSKLYALYQERCVKLEKEPPEPGWDGVYTHESK